MEEINQEQVQETPQVQQIVENTPQNSGAVPEVKESKHWAAMRADKARIERERDEAVRRAQELEARYASPKPSEEDDEIRLDPDALAEGKHLAKLVKQVKKMDAQRLEDQKRYENMIAEAKVKADFPDYYAVVNEENIGLLKTIEPEIAESLGRNPDLYRQAVGTYKAIKKLGIQVDDPYKDAKERVQANAAKPKAEASVPPLQGSSALGAAQDFQGPLSDDMKRKLFAEMNECRRGY